MHQGFPTPSDASPSRDWVDYLAVPRPGTFSLRDALSLQRITLSSPYSDAWRARSITEPVLTRSRLSPPSGLLYRSIVAKDMCACLSSRHSCCQRMAPGNWMHTAESGSNLEDRCPVAFIRGCAGWLSSGMRGYTVDASGWMDDGCRRVVTPPMIARAHHVFRLVI